MGQDRLSGQVILSIEKERAKEIGPWPECGGLCAAQGSAQTLLISFIVCCFCLVILELCFFLINSSKAIQRKTFVYF